jgi:hypothetical protein
MDKKEYDKIYREKNKLKIAQQKKEWYLNNKENVLENVSNYKKENEETIKEKNKKYREENTNVIDEWRKNNKEEVKEWRKQYREKNRDKINEYERTKRREDPLYWLKAKLRSNISASFKKKGYTKNSETYKIIGCTFEEFKTYLESKFDSWMNWDNRGLYNGTPNYGWDIDHIIPNSAGLTQDDIVKLNHYTNLQPLCSYYNRDIKKNK